MGNLTPLQSKLLALLEKFHSVCAENGLKYYIIFGTLLGAVRHNGFIPWDDDVDVAMPRSDYEKLKIVLAKPQQNIAFETASCGNNDFAYAFGKFYDTSTTLQEKSLLKPCRGIYIDVFQLDDAGNTEKESRRLYRNLFFKRVLLQSKLFPIDRERGFIKNSCSILARMIPFSPNKMANKLDLQASSNQGKETFKGVFLSTEGFDIAVMPATVYGKPRLYKFENLQVYGPSNAAEYLERVYGDWKKMPPVEKQVCRHDFIQIDLNKSYQNMIN